MDFKLALVQHPMYFLIRTDSVCAERTPPWGAEDIEEYIQRIRENLVTLRKYPQLKLGYEWSAYELELLHQDAPDVFQDMMGMVKSERSTLYNGTYSQPHLQILSSEANFRQFEVADKVYKELCHQQVLTYAHQECSINEQTPQLLHAFGIKFMPLPHFCSTLVIEGGEFIFHSKEGTMSVNGSEFTQWRGLDGTLTDVYLEEPIHLKIKEWVHLQEIKGFLHVPPLIIEVPDMVTVNDQWLEDRKQVDFVLLDDELPRLRQKYPPRFQSRIYTNWSYIEGIRAEELSRNNFLAERGALTAESLNAMAFVLTGRKPLATEAVWKTILATQHHDVYCFCGPDIRAKSIGWLIESQEKTARMIQSASLEVLGQVAPLPQGTEQVVVFNTLPSPVNAPVSVISRLKNPAIVDSAGNTLPGEVERLDDGHVKVTFLAEQSSFGYSSYGLQEGGDGSRTRATGNQLYQFLNSFYQCSVRPDGSFTSLMLHPGGDELLDPTHMGGNTLAGQDSTGLGSKHEGTINVVINGPSQAVMWEPPARGPELKWEIDGQPEIWESPLGTRFSVSGYLHPLIAASLQIYFYKELPRIEFEWKFKFDKASVGSFFDDESKLRVHWPLSFDGTIQHDIAFGVSQSLPERPFFPVSWVDVADGGKGFGYFHQGTIKHWVKDQILVNLFAWGENTDAIGNRIGLYRWPKTFDQRLDGEHIIRFAILPHLGDWRVGNVVSEARSYVNPPIAWLKDKSTGGSLPPYLDLFKIANANHIPTAVKIEDSDLLCRLYSISSSEEPVIVESKMLATRRIFSLSGEDIKTLAPFKIGKIMLNKR